MTLLQSADYFPQEEYSIALEPRAPQYAFPEHHHDFDEIVIVEQGSGIHVYNGQPKTLYAGCVCFIRSHDRHLYEQTNNLCLTNVLYRDANSFRFLSNLKELLPSAGSHWSINQKVMHEVLTMAQSLRTEGGWSIDKQAQQEQTFMRLVLLLRSSLQQCEQDDRLALLLDWLHSHYSDDIVWEELADQFAISLRTLHRKIKHLTGDTPQRYLNKLRLLEARYLLRHGEDKITDIAYQCGFGDSNHFSTLYSREFGHAPRKERQYTV